MHPLPVMLEGMACASSRCGQQHAEALAAAAADGALWTLRFTSVPEPDGHRGLRAGRPARAGGGAHAPVGRA